METCLAGLCWRGLWLWQREMGKTPPSGRLLSSFISLLFFFFFTACCLPGSVKKEGEEVKGVGEEREPCLPFGVQVFPEPDGTCLELCCARCEKCLTWQGVKWQKQTHVVNWALLKVFGMWLLDWSVLVTDCKTFRNLPILFKLLCAFPPFFFS